MTALDTEEQVNLAMAPLKDLGSPLSDAALADFRLAFENFLAQNPAADIVSCARKACELIGNGSDASEISDALATCALKGRVDSMFSIKKRVS
jgi:hypothetical protein